MRVTREFEVPLSVMQEEIARADFLPKDYARYRPLVAVGLRFFLERLSASRLRAILAEQMALPQASARSAWWRCCTMRRRCTSSARCWRGIDG